MAFAYKDRVKETTTTTGTGTITLAGAVTGFRTFQSVFSTSDTMYYVIDGGSGEWEVGLGTLATTTTLARTTVLASSNAGSAVNFSAGTKNVWCDIPASALIASGTTLSATGALTALSVVEAVGTSAITVTGATQTTSKPVLDLSQTWNNVATTFTGLKFNVTDTASASASLLMDLQVGGSSKFRVDKAGVVAFASSTTWYLDPYTAGGDYFVIASGTTSGYRFSINKFNNAVLPSTGTYGFTSSTSVVTGADTILSRGGVATLQHGNADAAAPVAQTISFQSVVAGTSNTPGVNATFNASRSTGSGTPGDFIFKTAGKGAATTTQNTLITALTIKGGTTNNTDVGYPSVVQGSGAALNTTATDGFMHIASCAGAPTGVPTLYTGAIPMVFDTTNSKLMAYIGGAWKGVTLA